MDITQKYIKYKDKYIKYKDKYIKYKQKYLNIKNIKSDELEKNDNKNNYYIKCCYGYYSIDW